MLNSETKRHIDAARDVLVGVAPNPTTQIDQITYALIYKFMDDMDQSAIKAGGKPSFFIGDLEPYAWSRLMDSRMGNQEKMNMYGEALTKFSEAKQLPELFRTIFRAAFLPYRSPETLGLFLKEIGYFDYSHPEELGNAYEYLLSIMSSQGDAGQFRTPRHIIDFIVDVINPTKDEKVLDPACGTAGFLVSAYNHILEQHDGKDDPKKKEKPLTPDERKKLMQNLQGYDIDPTMVRIAQVNMYLHQFKNPQIFQYDSLTSEERWSEKFDVILANPPFMTPKGGIKPHNKFSVPSNRAEVLFVDYIINHLRPKGRAGIIVPEGVIFQSGNAYKALRKNLIENGLYAVVSLPGGVFQPYSGVKTSILLIDNEIAKQKSEIAFVKISADGYDLGATKREVSQNDLPLAFETLKAWANGKSKENTIFTLVSKVEIAKNGAYNLSGDRYRAAIDHSNIVWPIARLNSICALIRGVTFSKKDEVSENGQAVLTASNLELDGTINLDELKMVSRELDFKESQKLIAGDIFICLASGSQSHVGKVAYVASHLGFHFGGFMGSIRVDITQVNSKYLYYQLKNERFNDYLSTAISGANIRNLSTEILGSYEIPLPPLEVQEQIVAELDGYAAITSGAKQIVENWKPKIDADPRWPKQKIGDFCKLHTGGTPTSSNKSFYGGDIRWLVSGDIHKGEIFDCEGRITQLGMENSNARLLPVDSVLIALNGQGKTRGTVALLRVPAACNQSLVAIEVIDNKLLPEFLYFTLNGMYRQIRAINGENQRGGLNMPLIREIEVPLPNLDIQQIIVSNLLLEKSQVDSAKKLIATYEARTQGVIAKLWSE